MVLPKQPITFRFGAADQDTGTKHLRPGVLQQNVNTRQLKRYDYRLRRGYGRVAFDTDDGDFTGPPDSFVFTDTRLVRDAAGANWALDPTTDKFRNLGTVVRPWPTTTPVLDPDSFCSPCLVYDGANDWTFAVRADGYVLTVKDHVTGRAVVRPSRVAVAGLVHLCAVATATNVHLFYVTGATTVRLHTYDVAAPSTPVVATTYQTIGGATFQNVDAHLYASGAVAVVAASDLLYSHSYLDTAIGAAKVSPAAVTTSGLPAHGLGGVVCSGISFAVSDGTNGEGYYSLWRPGAADAAERVEVKFNTTTLATISTTVLETTTASTDASWVGTCGNLEDNGDRTYLVQGLVDVTFTGLEESLQTVTRYTVTPANAVTSAPFGRSCWLASKPFRIADAWFVLTGTTQGNQATLGTAPIAGNSYHLRSTHAAPGAVLAQLEYALGPTTFNNRNAVFGYGNSKIASVYAVAVVATDAFLATISDGAAVRTKISFGETYAPGVVLGNKMVVPGPIPYSFGAADLPRELAPLLAPMAPSGGSAGTDRYVQVVYRFQDSDTSRDRGAPSVLTGFTGTTLPNPLVVPTLRHTLNPEATAQIEVYITDTGSTTPVLRYVRPNDVTVDSINIDTSGSAVGYYDGVDPEDIYTTGNGLTANPPPACRCLVVWGNRVVVSGTQRRGQVLPSMELKPLEGPRFNNVLASSWPETRSDVLRLEPIDWNNCAVMSATALGVISGSGPTDLGQGPFVVQTVPFKKGLRNARAAVGGPSGVVFQSTDARDFLLAGLAVEDVSLGVLDYSSPVATALHVPDDHNVLLWLEDGKILCQDYNYPTEEQPRGQWHQWGSEGLPRAYGAALVDGVPEHIEFDGSRRSYQSEFTDSDADGEVAYGMTLVSGELAVFDLGHEFRVDQVVVHGSFVGACELTLTLTFDYGTAAAATSVHTKVFAGAPFQCFAKPANAERVQSVKFALTTSGATEQAVFSGLTLVVQDRGITKFPNVAQQFVD